MTITKTRMAFLRKKSLLCIAVLVLVMALAGCSSNNKVVSDEAKSLLGVTGFVASSCTDSDGGKNYGVRGTTVGGDNRGNSGSSTDSCIATGKFTGRLNEYYCTGTFRRSVLYDCSLLGKVCKSGACIPPPDVPAVCGNGVRTGPEECDDGNLVSGDGCSMECDTECIETDGGINADVKGTNTLRSIRTLYVRVDSCLLDDTVHEYFCPSGPFFSAIDENMILGTYISCDSGKVCVDGACVNQ